MALQHHCADYLRDRCESALPSWWIVTIGMVIGPSGSIPLLAFLPLTIGGIVWTCQLHLREYGPQPAICSFGFHDWRLTLQLWLHLANASIHLCLNWLVSSHDVMDSMHSSHLSHEALRALHGNLCLLILLCLLSQLM